MSVRAGQDWRGKWPRLSLSVKDLRRIKSNEEFDAVLESMRNQYRLEHATFLIVHDGISPRPHSFYCTTYPREWTSVYLRKDYFDVDPVIALSRTALLPVDWSDLRRTSAVADGFFKEAPGARRAAL